MVKSYQDMKIGISIMEAVETQLCHREGWKCEPKPWNAFRNTLNRRRRKTEKTEERYLALVWDIAWALTCQWQHWLCSQDLTVAWVGLLICIVKVPEWKSLSTDQLSRGFSCFCSFPLGSCWTNTSNWTMITSFLVHTNSFFTNSPTTLCSEFLTVLLNKIRQLHLCLMMFWLTMLHDGLLL
jgi:hypothetical protein